MQYAPTRLDSALMTEQNHHDDSAERTRLKNLEARISVLESMHERGDMAEHRGTIEFSIQHLQTLRANELKGSPELRETPCRTQNPNRATFPVLPTSYGRHSRLTV